MSNQSGGNSFLVPRVNDYLNKSATERKFNSNDFQLRIQDFQEKKARKIAYLKEEKETKAYEECTFKPNNANSSHSSILGAKARSVGKASVISKTSRNPQQFLEDQNKKEEERLMKISLQMELADMRQRQELRETPTINAKSKRIAERKQLETSLA